VSTYADACAFGDVSKPQAFREQTYFSRQLQRFIQQLQINGMALLYNYCCRWFNCAGAAFNPAAAGTENRPHCNPIHQNQSHQLKCKSTRSEEGFVFILEL